MRRNRIERKNAEIERWPRKTGAGNQAAIRLRSRSLTISSIRCTIFSHSTKGIGNIFFIFVSFRHLQVSLCSSTTQKEYRAKDKFRTWLVPPPVVMPAAFFLIPGKSQCKSQFQKLAILSMCAILYSSFLLEIMYIRYRTQDIAQQ